LHRSIHNPHTAESCEEEGDGEVELVWLDPSCC
jgi:hypothetical protein